jgi:hypothetical protein
MSTRDEPDSDEEDVHNRGTAEMQRQAGQQLEVAMAAFAGSEQHEQVLDMRLIQPVCAKVPVLAQKLGVYGCASCFLVLSYSTRQIRSAEHCVSSCLHCSGA